MQHRLIAALFALALALPAAASALPAIGQPAPDFTGNAVDGSQIKLSDYKGKIVVLEWNNPGCPFVHKHYDSGNMQKLQNFAHNKGVTWLAINSGGVGKEGNMDASAALIYMAQQRMIVTQYILDPEGTIGKLYGAKTTPHMFVIGADGKLAYMGAIDDKPTANLDDVATAHNYVRAAIDNLSNGEKIAVPTTQSYGCSVKYAD